MSLAIDTTGLLPANLITNESILTSAVYSNSLKDIYPAAGPFWATGLVVSYTDNLLRTTTLVLGTDYSLQYVIPTVVAGNGSYVYGALRLINSALNGTIKLTYQAFGGSWIYNAADIAAYQAQNYLNPLAQQVVLAPDPMVYAGNNNTVLDSFANITAFQTLFAPVKLGVAYLSLSGPAAGSGAPLPTNAAQESGGNLAAIAGSTATGTTTLASILTTLQAKQDLASSVWFDGLTIPPTYYIRRETTSVNGTTIAVTWETPAGNPVTTFTPQQIAALQAVSNSENIHNFNTSFVANTTGAGYNLGDLLSHVFGVDMAIATPNVAYNFWLNLTQGTVLGTAPSGSSLNAVTTPVTATALPLPSGAATNAAQASAQSSFNSIISALQGTLVTEDVGLNSIIDSQYANYVYFCEAPAGTLPTATGWRISRLATATGITTWASGTSTFDKTPYSGVSTPQYNTFYTYS